MKPKLNVKISRDPTVVLHPFIEFFQGFENVETVNLLFGEKTEEVINKLQVEFSGRGGYMGVSKFDGHLIISADYLKNGDIIDIYLDIIHELVHVKQFMEGRELFDDRYHYVDRPTEIEAYCCTIKEARRLGLNEKRLFDYLKTAELEKSKCPFCGQRIEDIDLIEIYKKYFNESFKEFEENIKKELSSALNQLIDENNRLKLYYIIYKIVVLYPLQFRHNYYLVHISKLRYFYHCISYRLHIYYI